MVSEKRPVINLTLSEPIKTSSLSGKISYVNVATNANIQTYTRYYPGSDMAAVNIFTREDLVAGQTYKVRVEPGIEDMSGNLSTSAFEYVFSKDEAGAPAVTAIDLFESGIANWWAPQQSGTTTGILTDTTNIYSDGVYINHGSGSAKSMKLTYGWDPLASQWLIREYYGATSASISQVQNYYLESMVFGDGSGNKIRFCLNDAGNGGHEVNLWKTIDWFGWKLVRWDLSRDTVGNWIGNGSLEPPLSFDSYQLTWTPGKKNLGTLYFDDLQFARYTVTDVEQELSGTPVTYGLSQNFPNPFNPVTVIRYALPVAGDVEVSVYNSLGQKVRSLVYGYKEAGNYQVTFEAADLPSGLYLYELRSGGYTSVRKMILMK